MHNIRFNSSRIFLLSWLIVPLMVLWISTNYIIGLTHKPAWSSNGASTASMTAPVIDAPAIQPLQWNNEPLITLWFDDAWQTQFSEAYKQMHSRGLTGSLAVPTSFVGQDSYMGWSQIKLMQHEGWEISSHTRTHDCKLSDLTPNFVDTELHGALSDLNQHGIRADNFVTPCGASNGDMLTAAKKYYSSLRSSEGGVNTLPVTNPYNLKVRTIVRTTTIEEVDDWIKEAKSSNSWLILVFHQIDHDQTEYGTTPENLSLMLDHVQQSHIKLALPEQALQVGATK
jgi:peptidoglycan/xylan/chitin deacetylase (PgdA/CDA1 family)